MALLLFCSVGAACAAATPTVVTLEPRGEDAAYRHEIQSKDGQPHGTAIGYHENGRMAYHGTFMEGQPAARVGIAATLARHFSLL